jgi:hypothetical protein
MIKKISLLIVTFFLSINLMAEQFILEGKVTNTRLEPLSFVTVQIKSQQMGTRTDDNGHYKLKLEEGEYDLIFSLIGYRTIEQKVIVRKSGMTLNLILETSTKGMNEVKITANKKDKAEEYIRQVIKSKEANLSKINTFSCNAYIRATETLSSTVNKKNKKNEVVLTDSILQKRINDSVSKSLNNMHMAEIYMRVDYEYPDKIKEERTGIKKRGNTASLFYMTTTDGDFSLYNNLIRVPALTQTPMLSPISYSGLVGYKFKTIKVDKKSGHTLYTIKFSPVKAGNALIDGEVVIVDTSWSIIDARYTFPSHLLTEYDKFEAIISYELIQQKTWMLDRLELNYFSKSGKSKNDGTTLVIFDDYKIDTVFKKKYFTTEVSSTSLEAYERDSTFWNTVRKEPLTEKELQFIHFKDSIFDYTHTTQYLDSIDKKNNKVTWNEVLFTGVSFYKRANERTISFYPITSIYRFLYPGGARFGTGINYKITPKNKKTFSLGTDIAYGGLKKDLIGFLRWFYRYNPFNNGYINMSTGRNYELVFANDSYINILRRSNFYKKDYIELEHGVELMNGLVLRNKIEFAHRTPIQFNNTDNAFDQLLSNAGSDTAKYNVFNPYNVFYNVITLEYTPRQMYMREPRQKVILGSKYPTVYGTWRKGVPGVIKSIVDYDYVEFGLKQRLKLGLLGISDYKVFTGNFLTKTNLQQIDYKFIRRGDPWVFNEPTRNFQSLDSTFPVLNTFFEGHYLHEFYGALINKIPYLKKLKLYEIAGGGALYVPERKLIYFELFAGLEKPFKLFGEKFKLGAYVVSSIANQQNNPFQFKIGLQHYDIYRNRWE